MYPQGIKAVGFCVPMKDSSLVNLCKQKDSREGEICLIQGGSSEGITVYTSEIQYRTFCVPIKDSKCGKSKGILQDGCYALSSDSW